jgi:hypothetical protein
MSIDEICVSVKPSARPPIVITCQAREGATSLFGEVTYARRDSRTKVRATNSELLKVAK